MPYFFFSKFAWNVYTFYLQSFSLPPLRRVKAETFSVVQVVLQKDWLTTVLDFSFTATNVTNIEVVQATLKSWSKKSHRYCIFVYFLDVFFISFLKVSILIEPKHSKISIILKQWHKLEYLEAVKPKISFIFETLTERKVWWWKDCILLQVNLFKQHNIAYILNFFL